MAKPAEITEARKTRASRTLAVLRLLYPDPAPHLAFRNPWELLVATVLAAQCTDARVNQVTPALFQALPDIPAFAAATQETLEALIHSTGFYRNKARHLIAAAKKILDDFNGFVPDNMRDLLTLDGVARKTANVVLCGAFGKNEGMAVDTHVGRIALRLDLSDRGTPEYIERALCVLFPREEWGNVNHRMVSFGREYCTARAPACPSCPMRSFCPGGR
ncbi:MAG: endonuclease III [Deltaproteobacteria bacterium]|jgi:endonuclease-3|nr:endonuclease III [Deltaproteobacteria bacterium]